MKLLVTGATGFLGSRAAELLERNGHRVVRVARPEGAERAGASAAVRIDGFWLGDWAKRQPIRRMLLLFRQVRSLMTQGTLTSDIAATYPLAQAAEAAAHSMAPGKGGKVVLKIGAE